MLLKTQFRLFYKRLSFQSRKIFMYDGKKQITEFQAKINEEILTLHINYKSSKYNIERIIDRAMNRYSLFINQFKHIFTRVNSLAQIMAWNLAKIISSIKTETCKFEYAFTDHSAKSTHSLLSLTQKASEIFIKAIRNMESSTITNKNLIIHNLCQIFNPACLGLENRYRDNIISNKTAYRYFLLMFSIYKDTGALYFNIRRNYYITKKIFYHTIYKEGLIYIRFYDHQKNIRLITISRSAGAANIPFVEFTRNYKYDSDDGIQMTILKGSHSKRIIAFIKDLNTFGSISECFIHYIKGNYRIQNFPFYHMM